jgi:hypothetical protein
MVSVARARPGFMINERSGICEDKEILTSQESFPLDAIAEINHVYLRVEFVLMLAHCPCKVQTKGHEYSE